ncbi:MAG: dephospho-CoA kinase [Saprospiraceae bacterium]|nr:MAG: dephospho-CoA kinase [Bacteroidetes bacterium OLB9]MCO6464768.1 dephospho-CoA kinase [Saprospiraceae bacterium]MCZ2339683.1 dephospho-CoA kinase [Chitinophagales bacterium]
MKKIGLTGGIGSGKTTVSRIFSAMGIPVYDADTAAKNIMIKDKHVKKQMKELLGDEAFYSNGKPNRDYISSIIFSNKEKLQQLNGIIHPAVINDSLRWTEMHQHDHQVPYVIKEAALMVESGSFKILDDIIVVTCPENIRISRVMQRDRQTYDQVKRKIDNQMPEEEKVKYAKYVIVNDGETSLIPQVWAIHQKLIKR